MVLIGKIKSWLPTVNNLNIRNLHKRELNTRVILVNELACLYLHAKTVVLDSLARLQAVKDYFQRIIQVGLVGMEEHVYVQFKEVRYILVTERTLFKKLRLVLFQRIGL